MTRSAITLAILATLTGCDVSKRNSGLDERLEKGYVRAMKCLNAEHFKEAVAELEGVLKENPGNGAARFQLATIQEEPLKDYVAAYCNYREFFMQRPKSDKAGVARQHFGICERELAKTLSEKHGFGGGAALANEIASLRKQLKATEEARTKLERDFTDATRKIAALEADRKRMVAVIKTDPDTESTTPNAPPKRDIKALLEETEDDEGDRIARSRDAAALRVATKADEEDSSSLLPAQPAVAPKAKPAEAAKPEPLHEARPATYVVQEGDTLMRIAMRFYGHKSAWQKIRNANKAVIGPDGRVRRGDVIRLP